MTPAERLGLVAETDSSFRRVGSNWVGKCLICNGPLAFDIKSGEGATLEHILRGAAGEPRIWKTWRSSTAAATGKRGRTGMPGNAGPTRNTRSSSPDSSNDGSNAGGQGQETPRRQIKAR